MPIFNATKDLLVTPSFEWCITSFEQMRGMMFRKEVVPLIFRFDKQRTVNLHSWFCPGEMDLVFVNEDWVVVEVFSDWEKRSSYSSRHASLFLLELPAGSIASADIEVGDLIHIVD